MRSFYLEQTSRSDVKPKLPFRNDFIVRRAQIPCPDVSMFFYTAVGREYSWTHRLHWTAADWSRFVCRPSHQLWIAYLSETPAGFFELERSSEAEGNIALLGLLPHFHGLGLGGHLTTAACNCAWDLGVKRVWLHTCTLDHSHALGNYLARGFRLFAEEQVEIPDGPVYSPVPA